jgi:type III pantothenate kinase
MNGLLTVDVSNTHTALALWTSESESRHWQIASDTDRTADEYRVLLTQLLARDGLAPGDVRDCVLACVVPALLGTLRETCRALFGADPLVVGPGVRSGLHIRAPNPREVGADRIANAVAASARFGGPVIVLDFGTALTVDVVGPNGDYLGAVIAPGMAVAADALARRAAQLGRIELVAPPTAIARDTERALQSGLVFGYIGLVEGLARRVRDEIGPARVVATGEEPWVPALLERCPIVDAYEPLLALDGLRRIYLHHHGLAAGGR